MRRFFALAVMVSLLALPGVSRAHSEVESTEPAADSKAEKGVDHLYLNFSEKPSEDSVIEVTDGCGDILSAEVFVEQQTLHVLLDDKGASGKWNVDYRIISAEDGHETSGSYGFTVQGKKNCGGGGGNDDNEEPTDEDPDDEVAVDDDGAPTSDEGSSFPVMIVLIGALAVIGIGIVVRVAGSSK